MWAQSPHVRCRVCTDSSLFRRTENSTISINEAAISMEVGEEVVRFLVHMFCGGRRG